MASFLIVDGDRNFREALAIALRLDGHSVMVAEAADDALGRLGNDTVDCCVIDAHLWDADVVVEAAAGAGVRTILTGPYADILACAARRHPRAEALAKPFPAAALAPPAA